MQTTIFNEIAIAFGIWITAVLINTVLGCLLFDFKIFWFGIILSAIFSLPVLFFLSILLFQLFNKNASFNWIMGALMLTAIAGGYLSMLLFESEFGFILAELRVTPMVSGLIAVTIYKPALKAYHNKQTIKTTQHENNMV